MKFIHFVAAAAVCAGAFLFQGCKSPQNVAYLQDMPTGVEQTVTSMPKIVARPGDRIQIVVNCSDPQTSALFALLQPTKNFDMSGSGSTATGQNSTASFQVDNSGNIQFPILGNIHVGGLTAPQVADLIKEDLVKRQLVKDPVVVADFSNLHYSVIGEVSSPGQYPIYNNRVTILEAIADAGDLTIFGRRDNVKVIREANGKRTTYLVDLRDGRLFDSPAYYLQQNDVVYVEPNEARAGQSTVNENVLKTPGFWMSLGSFLMSAAVLIFR